jgi:hypothetical protein
MKLRSCLSYSVISNMPYSTLGNFLCVGELNRISDRCDIGVCLGVFGVNLLTDGCYR